MRKYWIATDNHNSDHDEVDKPVLPWRLNLPIVVPVLPSLPIQVLKSPKRDLVAMTVLFDAFYAFIESIFDPFVLFFRMLKNFRFLRIVAKRSSTGVNATQRRSLSTTTKLTPNSMLLYMAAVINAIGNNSFLYLHRNSSRALMPAFNLTTTSTNWAEAPT